MEKIMKPRGTMDILAPDVYTWNYIEKVVRDVAARFGFSEVRVPTFEEIGLFRRGVGESTDVVQKEMYTFTDKDGAMYALRPEGTAGVVRAFVSNGMQQNLPVKMYYHGPMFRYERPQKGRQRQFTQFGVELLGVDTPQADIEVISMAYEFLENLGLSGAVTVEINSLGDEESRNNYRAKLVEYLKGYYDVLSEDSRIRLEKKSFAYFRFEG